MDEGSMVVAGIGITILLALYGLISLISDSGIIERICG